MYVYYTLTRASYEIGNKVYPSTNSLKKEDRREIMRMRIPGHN